MGSIDMTRDFVEKYYLAQDRNCAETLFLAANEAYGLGLTGEDCKLVSAFGGGLGCGSTCGALCGAMAVLGKLRVGERAHATAGFREECAALAAEFEKELGAMDCKTLAAKYKSPEQRCLQTVLLAADVLDRHMGVTRRPKAAPSEEDIKRVKALGFLNCKGTDTFNARVITRNGLITAAESRRIADAAEKFGTGDVAMTTRLTIEIQGVPYENIGPLRAFLAEGGLETGGTGSKVRPVVSCKGTTCQYGLYDTFALSRRIHELFYEGYHDVKLPHKFKIACGGCPNNCVKPNLNDVGVVGQRVPLPDESACRGCARCAVETACPIGACRVKDGKLEIDAARCNHCGRCIGKCPFGALKQAKDGFLIYIGGRWGKQTAQGRPLAHIFATEDEALAAVEKAILLYRDQGITGERFADTIERLGFGAVQAQLLGNELLRRKDEILRAEKHLVGGATC